MSQVIFEILLIAVLILINGLFSMTEIAVVSSRRVRLSGAAAAGSKGAKTAIELQESPERFLSTVQVGITLVGILSGAFGGALLSDEIAELVAGVPFLAPYSATLGFLVVIILITYFSLVVGELVPKNIALNRPETVATMFSRPMSFISRAAAPLVWLLGNSTTLLLKLLRIRPSTESAITEEEIRAHIAHGTELGVLDQTEQEMIEGVIKLDDQRVTALMTSRMDVNWLDLDDGIEINRAKLIETPFSRLPVARGDLDNILGVVKARDLLSQVLSGGELNIEQALKQPIFVPSTRSGLELLETFQSSHTLMAVVIDEFGSVEGLITINDLLEEIVGDLPSGGIVHQSFVVRDDGSMLMDGKLSVVDFKEILRITNLPDDEVGSYQTLAGFVLARLERLPIEGDKFTWESYEFEVIDMDGRRVDKVLVTNKEGAAENE